MTDEALTWDNALSEITAMLQGRAPFSVEEESAVMQAWARNPAAVMTLARKAAAAYANGTIARPWAWLAKAASAEADKRVNRSVTADPTGEIDTAERKAVVWMRNIGVHYDRWSEVEDDLFGERGLLRHWRDDPLLLEGWRDRWVSLRPEGAAAEVEALMRADLWRASPASEGWVKPEHRKQAAADLAAWAEGINPHAADPLVPQVDLHTIVGIWAKVVRVDPTDQALSALRSL